MTEQTQAEGRTDDVADEQDLAESAAGGQTQAEPAAEDSVQAASGADAEAVPSVNLDVAEQQVAEWRREDAALLGEAPEMSPSSRETPPPTTAVEADVASMREETEELLGEPLEASALPTANEAEL
ncbi:MAG TPA: hypothetical protein VFW71_02195 [Actinomycetota bacterium]|nr:hypothetical protein [Actinomycetota bacterium]